MHLGERNLSAKKFESTYEVHTTEHEEYDVVIEVRRTVVPKDSGV